MKTVCVKGFFRSFRVNKTLGHFGLRAITLDSKTETTKMEKRNLNIAMKTLNEVSVEFSETKQFIEEHLEQKYLKENISVEEVIYFFLTSLEAKSLHSKYCKAGTFLLELHLIRYLEGCAV